MDTSRAGAARRFWWRSILRPRSRTFIELDAGGAAIYEESFNLKQYRNDVACYPVPFDKITASCVL